MSVSGFSIARPGKWRPASLEKAATRAFSSLLKTHFGPTLIPGRTRFESGLFTDFCWNPTF
jgi:hypothetical protein